jgi:iron complex outermembrane recepter protein
MEPLLLMRLTLLLSLLLCASTALAQDSIRRVEAEPVTVSDGVSPIPFDSLPIASSYRRIPPLQTASSYSLDQAVRAVPGLQIDNRNNYALGDRITIRGMGARSFFGTRGVRVYKDDIPLTFADGQTNFEIIDPSQITAVRVLRGPAGHLYGNASGGSLLMSSVVPPSLGSFAQFAATFGSWGYQRLGGSIGSRGEDLSYGAYITLDSMTGYRDWSGMKSMHLGTQSIYTFGEDALRFTFDHVNFSAQNPGSLPYDSLTSSRRVAFAQNLARKTGKEGDQSQLGITYRKKFESDELITSAYTVLRSALNPTPQQIIDLDRKLFGVRSVYRGERISNSHFAGSLDIQYQLDQRLENANSNGAAGALQTDQNENIFAAAVGYAVSRKNTLGISDLLVTTGFRYDVIHFSASDNLIDSINPDHSGSRWMNALSMNLGLAYEVSPAQLMVMSFSRGFETPTSTELANQPNLAGGFNNDLNPQRTTGFDLGMKGAITDALDYSAIFFMTEVSSALIPFEISGQEGQTYYRNAGKVTNIGGELEIVAKPVTGLTLAGAFTTIQSRFTDYVVGGVSYSSKLQPGVHPMMAALDATYYSSSGPYVNLSGKWASRVAVNDANDAHSPEYTVLDVKLGYPIAMGGLGPEPLLIEPFVHVQNVFDRKYVGSFSINAFGRRYYEPSPERSIFAGVQIAL